MRKFISTILAATLVLGTGPAGFAQVRTIDPNQAIDSDLSRSAPAQKTQDAPVPLDETQSYPDGPPGDLSQPSQYPANSQYQSGQYPSNQSPSNVPQSDVPQTDPAQDTNRANAETEAATATTFKREELLRAAESTFGKGTSGLAGMLEKLLKEQGEPNAYIAGSEASGAIVVGLRYGKGELFHKIEGQQKIYWTGPSVGFDLGGDGNKVFALVYNLHDSEDLYKRFPAGEGRLYFVGGLAATYLRRGDIVIIPIRLGIGWRQGVNIGYMKFSHKSKWFPL
ncbi:DUF1134 domain-containing protein [Sphingomonas alpina]|uniref:DUF1134 domain-containing protein n=1 Tax=Sphingomonas alpina TaxID=653931 RepID=A0A7H0LJ77_9SPHN|nr:DUF1134 domain-containing protein [Sphingomonas alpina]QNQ09730.1 DUF1134 domain-containing protein [Sphingomonas alpina]